ncbi:MAG: tyrosine-type recombinase/integrase [Bacillota bacterium]
MRKRTNGDGSITKKRDKYMVQLTVGYDQDGRQIRKTRTADSLTDARLMLRELQDRYANSIDIDDTITLGEWAAKCLEVYIKPRVRANTYAGYLSIARNYMFKHACGRIKLGKFKQIQLQELVNNVTGSPKLKKSITQLYKQIFNIAVENGVLAVTPIRKIALPQIKRREFVEYSQEQLDDILNNLKPHPLFYIGFVIMLASGIRRSELLGLTWNDYNRAKGTISINKAVIRAPGGPQIADCKSEKSNRILHLPQIILDELDEYRREAVVLSKFIIHNNGKIYEPADFSVALRRRANCHLRLHDLRHAFATRLLRNGVNIKIIQELLGHSDIRLTLDTYSHVLDEEKKAAMDIAGLVFKR